MIDSDMLEEKENKALDAFIEEILGCNDHIEMFKALQRYDLMAGAQAKRLTAVAAITTAEMRQ
jgi:hypothetical protein